MNTFKQRCIALRKKDFTLNEIMKITGRGKTSVYFHIRDIALSKKKKREICANTKQIALNLARARKGKALRSYKPFEKWSSEFVLLVAHLMFDGEILKKRCVYNNRSETLIFRVENLMQSVYNYSPHIHIDRVSGVKRIQYNNVELRDFLYVKACELIAVIKKRPKIEQREFVRAFFDDEGCMDVRLNRNLRRVRGYQKDREILMLIQSLLKNFDIASTLQGKNEVVISGKENLIKFQKEINFSKGVRLNPKRSNSIWKKPIEKRELLAVAIESFKN
ncbi:LAGLIDADG family homing endonuclease [Candidatus Pacebacteria bacterium]|nr:LAGLIDADG family homing endonuclease [Candidatus Paceibacterota bacterium]